jgi:hypothetical protein
VNNSKKIKKAETYYKANQKEDDAIITILRADPKR